MGGDAMNAVPTNPAIMLPVVRPTPTMKLALQPDATRDASTALEEGPQERTGQRAPRMLITSCAMNVMDEL